MLNLSLTNEETIVLENLIECCILDLRSEIIHTDNWQFKDELKKRKQILLSLLDRVKVFEHAPAGD